MSKEICKCKAGLCTLRGKRVCRGGEIVETYKDWRKRGKFKAIKSQINWQMQYPFMLLKYLFTSGMIDISLRWQNI